MERRFGLIGTNISHSKNPALFNAAYSNYNFTFSLLDFPDFTSAIQQVNKMNLEGVNVTTPFKDEAYSYANKRDTLCETIEASNLLLFKADGVYAYNTDYFGVKDTLAQYTKSNIKTLVIGCGGAGRAAALAVKDLGHYVSIANRTIEKALRYSNKIGVTAIPFSEANSALNDFDIIINTLSVNIPGLNFAKLSGKVIFQASYLHSLENTEITQKNICIKGEQWLINQAFPSYRLFTGIEPDINAMRLIISM
jgi:shikimate dehydrogenase